MLFIVEGLRGTTALKRLLIKVAFVDCGYALSLSSSCLKLKGFVDCQNATEGFSKFFQMPQEVFEHSVTSCTLP
jgi:hypothetical protein